MGASDKANTSQSSIEAILRGLTDRPNVESTLILSRKDGSIIKAAGFDSAERRRRAQSTAAYSADSSTRTVDRTDGSAVASEDTSAIVDSTTQPSPAEELAASIFQFVKSAALLGSTLCSVAAGNEGGDGTSFRYSQQGPKAGSDGKKPAVDDNEELRNESQVQLLRLRIKLREIIIFPDPQYLCCVVQTIGKQGSALER